MIDNTEDMYCAAAVAFTTSFPVECQNGPDVRIYHGNNVVKLFHENEGRVKHFQVFLNPDIPNPDWRT